MVVRIPPLHGQQHRLIHRSACSGKFKGPTRISARRIDPISALAFKDTRRLRGVQVRTEAFRAIFTLETVVPILTTY